MAKELRGYLGLENKAAVRDTPINEPPLHTSPHTDLSSVYKTAAFRLF